MEAIEAKDGLCLRPQSDKVVELSLDCPQQRVVAEELSHRGHEHLHVRAVPTMQAAAWAQRQSLSCGRGVTLSVQPALPIWDQP